jgi:hypothetical protein
VYATNSRRPAHLPPLPTSMGVSGRRKGSSANGEFSPKAGAAEWPILRNASSFIASEAAKPFRRAR